MKRISKKFKDRPKLEVHILKPHTVSGDVCAYIVIEYVISPYRQDVALFIVGCDGRFNVGNVSDDVFCSIEDELGYLHDMFLYEAEWHGVLSGLLKKTDKDTLVEVLQFIDSNSGKGIDVDEIVREVEEYTKSVDVSCDSFF